MVARRYDGNKCGKGITSFPRHAFQGIERERWDNGANGLAPFCVAGHFPRRLDGNANTVDLWQAGQQPRPNIKPLERLAA